MADLSDVENVLQQIVTGIVYPNTTAQPSIAAIGSTLNGAVIAGATTVTVASAAGLSAGLNFSLYGGTLETAQVSPAYDPQGSPNSVPLTAPLAHAHADQSKVTWNDNVRIYRGWPIAAELDADLLAGTAHVSVFSMPNTERNTTRYPRDDIEVAPPVHTLIAAVNGNTITIGGTVAVPQNVIALAGTRSAYPYGVQANDTLATIATALAALIAADYPGTAAVGPVITVAGKPGVLQARIASSAKVWTEQKRQERAIDIICWCPTPAMRDILAGAIDLALSEMDFITMPDKGAARLRYEKSPETDDAEKVQLFRRDLIYMVEYATASVTDAYEIGALGITVQEGAAGPGGAAPDTNYY